MSRAETSAGPADAQGAAAPQVPAPAAGSPGPREAAGPAGERAARGPVAGRAAPAPAGRAPRAAWSLGLFRSELVTVFRRARTMALLGVLAGVPLLVGIAIRIETRDGGSVAGNDGGGPAFLEQVSNNGLFLAFASLAATLPFFLPMTIGVVGGDAIAGEAATGTLRYLLVAPAGRTRLLLAKYASVLVFCVAATLTVVLSAVIVGFSLFPVGDVTLLSGDTVSLSDGILRGLLIALLVAASLIGLAALGLFISTLTDSGIGAMAATVGLLITVQIVNSIPQLHVLQPYLFPHYWLSFADVMRAPVIWTGVLKNLALQALYAAVFGSAAWARFTTRDITA
jgi:ABC-2 type transport system permease protein